MPSMCHRMQMRSIGHLRRSRIHTRSPVHTPRRVERCNSRARRCTLSAPRIHPRSLDARTLLRKIRRVHRSAPPCMTRKDRRMQTRNKRHPRKTRSDIEHQARMLLHADACSSRSRHTPHHHMLPLAARRRARRRRSRDVCLFVPRRRRSKSRRTPTHSRCPRRSSPSCNPRCSSMRPQQLKPAAFAITRAAVVRCASEAFATCTVGFATRCSFTAEAGDREVETSRESEHQGGTNRDGNAHETHAVPKPGSCEQFGLR